MTQPPQQPWIPPERPGGPADPLAGLRGPAPAAPPTSTPPATRRSGGGRARRRRPLRRFLAVLGVLALLLVVALGAYGLLLARTFDGHRQTVSAAAFADPGNDGPVNFLVLGSDSRAAEDSAETSQRSDTMMLVHIPADRRHVYVISVLRDSLVEIPGHGQRKANAAYELGGPELTAAMLDKLLGVPVHHLAELDFQGFRGMTTALGGVEVCNPHAFSSGQKNPSFYPRGRIELKDTAALRYVRERHAFPEGDVMRVQNQQRFVRGAVAAFLDPAVVLNPPRAVDVVAGLSDHLTVDEGLDSATLASLAWQLRGVDRSALTMFTVPRAGYGTSPDGQDVVLLDADRMDALRDALQRDDVESYLRAHDPEALAAGEDVQPALTAAPGATPLLTELAAAPPAAATAAGEGTLLGEDPCGG